MFLLFLPQIHPEGIFSQVQVSVFWISFTVTFVPRRRTVFPDADTNE
jgi:hypothetical protein